ncbi:MAG TPA: head GIN domain-containing protein [Sphingomicrobium sp.]|nr:head GIN domain-containing protein [Sphingomicrobium sp.]
MRRSLALLIVASAALGAFHAHADESNGANVSRTYSVGNFQKIEVAGPYDVEVRTGGAASVAGQGSQRLLERTVVEVEGDKLVIHAERHRSWFSVGWGNHGKAHFTVTVPQLSGATIAGSGDINVDRVTGQNFEGTVAGSGGLDVAAVDVQQLKFSIAGAGGVKAGSGKARSAEYEIAGSGDVDASAIVAQQIKVTIAGSGTVKAHSSGTADVSIMGSGDVDVTGGAKCSISKTGPGNVRCS